MRRDQAGCGGCAARRTGRLAAALRVLATLVLLLQQAFLPASLPAARAATAATIEICTAEGVRLVALADRDDPRQGPQRDHAGHECPGCLAFCCKLLPCAGTVAVLVPERLALPEAPMPGRGLAAPPLPPCAAFQARAPPRLATI
ncbi:MAG: hypothetical protein U1E17_03790 [Geminicoccaceae bacterium]